MSFFIEHLRAAAILGKYLKTLTVIFDIVGNIEILVYETIWKPYLEHDIAWDSCFLKAH